MRRKYHLPENGLQIDCSKIASSFREGGGHPGAAAAFLKTNLEENGDSAALVEIECALQYYFEKLEQHN
jgi:nanoRNase/pAp phosphatase (c-di-AMP/oligoRNAs hydrolase)